MSGSKKSFYESMSQNNFMEKTASEHNEIKETLSGIDAETLQKLANEIDGIAEESRTNLERLASECDEESSKSEEDKKDTEEKKEAEDEKSEDEKSEDEKSEEKKEAEDEGENPEDKKETEEEVKKAAYELASQRLEKAGYTVADYVYSKVADEEIAVYISKNAEVISDMTEKTALEVADDILGALNEKLV